MAQFETICKSIFKLPHRRISDDKFRYSSINYLIPIITIKVIVNNNKIGNKIDIIYLLNSNKSITFASDKGTFVLLTIKKLILCLI